MIRVLDMLSAKENVRRFVNDRIGDVGYRTLDRNSDRDSAIRTNDRRPVGFVEEGRLRESVRTDTGYDSLIVMSMLEGEHTALNTHR